MNLYMMMMRGDHDAFDAMSANDKQALMQRYYAYVQRLKDENRFKGGNALSRKSRILTGATSESGSSTPKLSITDGPYADGKEALNGYFLIEATSLDEATRIGEDCPCLTHGEVLEVIEVTQH